MSLMFDSLRYALMFRIQKIDVISKFQSDYMRIKNKKSVLRVKISMITRLGVRGGVQTVISN
jgi:hypothetical protein